MGLGRKRAPAEDDATELIERREVLCASEDAARAEARRQQAAEPDEQAEWIYLRNTAGSWVARRLGRYAPAAHEPVSLGQAAKEQAISILSPLEWPWLFVP